MHKQLEYNGHFGSVEYSDDDGVHFGRIQFIRGLVTFEAADAESLEAAFRDAVDVYLDQDVRVKN
jgi:predicted HicB family RNase H-like nuclease